MQHKLTAAVVLLAVIALLAALPAQAAPMPGPKTYNSGTHAKAL